MPEAFPVSGNIDPISFPHLLVDLHRRGATGSLKVNGPAHPKALYFRGGRVLFGSSNDPRDQLGAILIESGRITREQLDEVNAKVGPGNPLAKVLAESGFVNQRELGDAARVKVERILADMMSWESGSFEFEDGVLPKGAVDLKLSTERLLLAAVQHIPERAFALRHLGALSVVLEAAPEGESALSEVRAEVWPLLERLDGHRTLKDAIALTRLDDFEAAKMACAMLFLGIVRRKVLSAEELDLAQEARIGLEETAPAAEPPSAEAPMLTVPVEPVWQGGPVFPMPQSTEAPRPVAPDEAAGFAIVEAEAEPGPEIAIEAPPSLPSPPSFTTDAPRRPGTDTVPGDRPAYTPSVTTPPPSFEPPPPFEPPTPPPTLEAPPRRASLPETSAPAPAPAPSRPSQEDLAALDAMLSPSASGRLSRPAERPRPERWEPQFRPPPAAVRRPPPAPAAGAPKTPFIAAGLAALAVAAFAGWYFLLRPTAPAPRRPVSTPVTRPTAVATAPETLSAPATLAPSSAPTPEVTAAPTATAMATPSPAPATPAPTSMPAATSNPPLPPRSIPSPAAGAGSTAPAAGDPRALLRQGLLPEAARGFVSTLSTGARGRMSVQLLVACAPETVQKAVANVPSDELFILPVNLKGRACYRLCWGAYDTRQGAEAALAGLPAYFRQGGTTPRLQPLAELLP